jgi:hypothetical protein
LYPIVCSFVSTKVLRPVPTLLGGSGRARASTSQRRSLPALLQRPVVVAAPIGIAC